MHNKTKEIKLKNMEHNKTLNQMNGTTMIVLSVNDLRNVVQEMVGDIQISNHAEQVQNHELDKLLSTNEVCSLLHVSRVTLYRWNQTGYLVPHKVGKKNMYKLQDINTLK